MGVACLDGQTLTHAMVPAGVASLWQSWWGWGGFGRGCAEEMGELSAVGPCPKLQMLMPFPSGEETKR